MMKNICVIGGGPAGMMAAYSASLSGQANVYLYEKNNNPGRKLLITGKGRCNLTNMGDLEDYMNNIPRNASFLYSSLSKFTNIDLISLFEDNGMKTKVERGERVFPESDKSSDVLKSLLMLLKRQNIYLNCGKTVYKIVYNEIDKEYEVFFRETPSIKFDAVILATGGLSYPQTGSTGDGYKLARQLGHSVTKLYPSLVALRTKENCGALAGLTLKNVAINICDKNGKKVFDDFGEMIFTHTGVSGPVILSGSAKIAELVGKEAFILYIDLKPALDEKMLDIRLLRDFNKYRNKDLLNALDELLPKKIIPEVIMLSGISPRKKVNEVSKSERKALISAIKAFALTITETEGYENAVITRGGISINEINSSTMESKIMKGLYFAGEILDLDAYTGGYNLQIAFSTGFLAGKSL